MHLFRLVSCLILASGTALAQSYSNGPAAAVQGKVITKSEVRDTVRAQEQILMGMFGATDPERMKREIAETRANALDALIDRELILIEFAKVGGVIKPQYVDDQINNIVREAFKGDRDALVLEILLAFKRAGCSGILTYHAAHAARLLGR